MYTEKIQKSIDDFSKIYGLAEKAYKSLQTLLNQIDDKIHNEFRYCSRALKEFVISLPNAKEEETLENILKAIHAVKNAFNDSIDLVLGFAALKIKELADIDSGKELILYIPNLQQILCDIAIIHNKIAESRRTVEVRISIYEEILDSLEFKRVVEFCNIVPILENNIRTDYGRIVRDARRFYITASLSALGILFAIIGAIEKLPDFIKFLSKFYPSLKQFT